jgi:hypothetical protein
VGSGFSPQAVKVRQRAASRTSVISFFIVILLSANAFGTLRWLDYTTFKQNCKKRKRILPRQGVVFPGIPW